MSREDNGLFVKGDEERVRIVQTKNGWHWKLGRNLSAPHRSEYAATQAARSALGHHPRRNYQRA